MKKIELKGNIEESLITLNNLRDFEIEEIEGSITLHFDSKASADSVSEDQTDPSDLPSEEN